MQRFKKFAMAKANLDKNGRPLIFGAPYGWTLAHYQASIWTGKFADLPMGKIHWRAELIRLQENRRADVVGFRENGHKIRVPLRQCTVYAAGIRMSSLMASVDLP
jgi:hypothetical protein